MEPLTDAEALAMSLDEFLTHANTGATLGLFAVEDYEAFRAAVTTARQAGGLPVYLTHTADEGGVTAGATIGAQWSVWVEPVTHEIRAMVSRVLIYGYRVTPHRQGGSRAYHQDWR